MVPVTVPVRPPLRLLRLGNPLVRGILRSRVPQAAERLAGRPRVRRASDRTEVRDPAAVRGDEGRASRGARGRAGQQAVVAILRRAAPGRRARSRAAGTTSSGRWPTARSATRRARHTPPATRARRRSSRTPPSSCSSERDNPGVRLYGDLAPWFHLLTAPEDYAAEAERYRALIHDAAAERRHAARAGLRRRQQRIAPGAALHVHAVGPLAADAHTEPRAQSRVRARPRRHAHAPARPDVRRCLRARRGRVHDDRERPPRLHRHGFRAHAARAASRCSCPTSHARRSRPAPRTAATTAPTGARCGTSSGRSTPTRRDTTYEVDYAVVVREPGQDAAGRPRPPRRRAVPRAHVALPARAGRLRAVGRPRCDG